MKPVTYDSFSPETRFYEAVTAIRRLAARNRPEPLPGSGENAGNIKKQVRMTVDVISCDLDLNDLANATGEEESEGTLNSLLTAFHLDHHDPEESGVALTDIKGRCVSAEYTPRAMERRSKVKPATLHTQASLSSFKIAICIIATAEVITAAVLAITLSAWLSKDSPVGAASLGELSRSFFSTLP